MKVKMVKYYWFEKKEKEVVKKWLKDNKLRAIDLANKLDVTKDHLYHCLSGDRPISIRLINKMQELGIEISLRARIVGDE